MAASDYERMARAIAYIESHLQEQPRLEDIARAVSLSPYYFQRVFSRWAGVSPKRLTQYLTLRYAQGRLDESETVLNATYDAGLSSTSRLHELFVGLIAATPAEYRSGGQGMTIRHGLAESPFGWCFVARTDRGIARLCFVSDPNDPAPLALLTGDWPAGTLVRDDADAAEALFRVFSPAVETAPRDRGLGTYVKGTDFQIKVWEALLTIPPGSVSTYGRIAKAIGSPGAYRAVGHAVSLNPIAYLIPCHRVIRQTGALGGYRWGTDRKAAILAWEGLRTGSGMADAS